MLPNGTRAELLAWLHAEAASSRSTIVWLPVALGPVDPPCLPAPRPDAACAASAPLGRSGMGVADVGRRLRFAMRGPARWASLEGLCCRPVLSFLKRCCMYSAGELVRWPALVLTRLYLLLGA